MSVSAFPLERRIGPDWYREAVERKRRLWNPPASYPSSELDVLSIPETRRRAPVYSEQMTPVVIHSYPHVMFRREVSHIPSAFALPVVKGDENPPLIDGQVTWPITIRDVARATCRYFNVSILDLVSDRRPAGIVRPRHIAMFLARDMTMQGFPAIGRVMGDRDHTTVLSAVRKVARMIKEDLDWADDVEAVRQAVLAARYAPTEQPITG